MSCGLGSPALVTQPRVPAVFLRGLQRPLGNPGADTCGPPGAASLLPALAESRQAREATDGRAARPPGWRTRSPAAFRVGGGGRRHGRGGRADSPVGFEKDPTLLSRGIRTSNKESLMKSWDTEPRGGRDLSNAEATHVRPWTARLLVAWPGLAPRPPADRVSGRPRMRGRSTGRSQDGEVARGRGRLAWAAAAPEPGSQLLRAPPPTCGPRATRTVPTARLRKTSLMATNCPWVILLPILLQAHRVLEYSNGMAS